MAVLKKIGVIFTLTMFISGVLSPNLSSGITIKEEEELAREYMKFLTANLDIVDDPVINDYINRLGKKLVADFPQQPFSYHFYVVKEDVYNAFATPAGHIFIYSGLIAAMDDEAELAGILAHEISHVFCRHISQKIDRSKKVNMATLAGVAAGILLGVAGAGQAASALTVGSMAAGQSAMLAYSRADEVQADQIGLVYLTKAGYDGRGLQVALNKIRSKQWFGSETVPSYLMTHPAVEDRLAYIDTFLERNQRESKAVARKESRDFKIAHARIVALYTDESLALRKFKSAVEKNPDNVIDRYGYGLTLARAGNLQDAVTVLKRALELDAFSPEILTALGRVYFLAGRYPEAKNTLESALSISSDNPEGLYYIGRTQLELGYPAQAETAFEALLNRGLANKQVYYFLGKAYGAQGKLADAHYTLGIYYLKKRELRNARIQFALALKKTEDPDRRKELEDRLAKIDEALKTIKTNKG